jgi:hypothetical protein
VPHQVREIIVRIEQLPDGLWRLTQPRVPGWAAAARNPVEVANALRRGFTEAQIAAHSDWRGHAYDANVPINRRWRRKRPSVNPNRRDVHDPREWRLGPDGRWISPRNNLYPEDTQAVQRVMSARRRMGLPERPDPVEPDEGAGTMSAGRGET